MSMIFHRILASLALVVITGCSSSHRIGNDNQSSAISFTPYSSIEWTPLNPARGDNSPKAGTLWGDRSDDVATGFLVQFKDGFSSPPHIHNVSYRGIVLSGLIHNDDPDAAKMWMPPGSYWTQPKGESHITAAKGSMNMAYIEIDEGPYLVRPIDQAFDSGERPINVDPSNIVWLGSTDGIQIAHLWGIHKAGQPRGTLFKLPKYFKGKISTNSLSTKGVVIQGDHSVQTTAQSEYITLDVGSAFESHSAFTLRIMNNTKRECIIYIKSEETVMISAN
ncbi:MAG: DUF4437 domain-containing protein [Phycisphaerales bacterium]|nr:DUF4437 domain-containing protein [Phycisphaerales bacterium]